jgi:hypothetical protein
MLQSVRLRADPDSTFGTGARTDFNVGAVSDRSRNRFVAV